MKTISNLILGFFLFSSLFYFFSYPEVDPDLWGHLFFGREIIRSGQLPLHNLYSYTAPDHPWINHEWLAEVVFYGFFSSFGSPGLILLKVVVGLVLVWILDLIIKNVVPSPFARVLTLVWTMVILSPGFNIRPQLFTYLFFAVFIFLFYRYEEGKKTALYWAPLVTVLWVNLHGGFVSGLGAFGLFSFWISLRGLRNRDMRPIVTQVLVPLIMSGIALLLNPYGLDLLSFLARDLLLDRPITEWMSIPPFDFSFLEFKLALFFIILFSARRDSWYRWDFVLVLLTALLALRSQRHTPLFGIAAVPFLAAGIQRICHWLEDTARESILATGLFVLALYQIFWIGRIHLQHRFQLVVSPQEYPIQAVDFLQRNGVRGNLAAPFDWGEYFIWKLYPEVRVSIDGRYTTAYPMEVIQDHWNWMEGKKEWKRLLERHPTEIAITNRYHPITLLLRGDPEWVYIYSDPVAFVFVKRSPRQSPLLERLKARTLLPPQPPVVYFPG